MIDLRTIESEIEKLEEGHASYPTCQKLADLYVVKDHLMEKGGGTSYARGGSNYNRGGSNYGYYNRGNNSNYTMYDDYYDGRMMDDEMTGMKSRMSMPSMR